jgi:hypothetical protein
VIGVGRLENARQQVDKLTATAWSPLIDIARWGNTTERTGPVSVEALGKWPEKDGFWNVMISFEAEYCFANGTRLTYKAGTPFVRFEGSEGWISTEFGNGIEASRPAILQTKLAANATRFPFKSDKQDFIDAVKTRVATLRRRRGGTPAYEHLPPGEHRCSRRRQTRWDPAKERFTGSDKANALLARPLYDRASAA